MNKEENGASTFPHTDSNTIGERSLSQSLSLPRAFHRHHHRPCTHSRIRRLPCSSGLLFLFGNQKLVSTGILRIREKKHFLYSLGSTTSPSPVASLPSSSSPPSKAGATPDTTTATTTTTATRLLVLMCLIIVEDMLTAVNERGKKWETFYLQAGSDTKYCKRCLVVADRAGMCSSWLKSLFAYGFAIERDERSASASAAAAARKAQSKRTF